MNKETVSGKNRKIGILGGSFDPIHMGHIKIAQSAYEEFHLDQVLFIPAGHSPNKREETMTDPQIRGEMTALAVADYPYFEVSRMEIDSDAVSYTYRTLQQLNYLHPDTQFYFIMGADSLDYLEKWYHPEIICQEAILLVAVRDDLDIEDVKQKIKFIQTCFPAEIYPLSVPQTDISSHEIRDNIKNGTLDPCQLPAAVFSYIKEKKLYVTC